MAIYVIDLDHTLCIPNLQFSDVERRYAQAEPMWDMVEAVQRLYWAGHTIILLTARRMVTHQGDVAKVEAEVGDLTRAWLKRYCVPYHELKFGKPYGDYYVDDKNLSIAEAIHHGNNHRSNSSSGQGSSVQGTGQELPEVHPAV